MQHATTRDSCTLSIVLNYSEDQLDLFKNTKFYQLWDDAVTFMYCCLLLSTYDFVNQGNTTTGVLTNSRITLLLIAHSEEEQAIS